MLKQQKFSTISNKQQQKTTAYHQIYNEIIKNFQKQASRIKLKYSTPAFDDALLCRPRKTLPKLQIQTQKKGRMKFYSNKLVVNESVYIHQRRQLSARNHEESEFNKICLNSPQPKEKGILTERNKRIMELYRRSQKDADNSPTRIRFSKKIQNPNKIIENEETNIQQQLQTNKKSKLRSSEKRMIDILKQAKQRRRKLQLPYVKPQRSKSNILINSYAIDTMNPEDNTLQGKSTGETLDQQQKRVRVKTMKKIKYEPRREISLSKKKFNWKSQSLSLNKIQRQQFQKLLKIYHNLGEVTPIQSGFYKAYIGFGNNCALIKKLLKDRGYWTIVQSLDEQPNFVWTQLKSSKFNQLLLSSQEKKVNPISRKNVQNLQNDSQFNNFLKLKRNDYISSCQKLFEHNHFLLLMSQIKQRFQCGSNLSYFSRLKQVYTDYLQQYSYKQCPQIKSSQIKLHNHMDNAGAIGDKKSLLYMMTKYCQIFQQNIKQFIPTTINLQNIQKIQQVFQVMPNGPWILKPGQATNRGTGITVHTTQQSLISQLNKKKKHKCGTKYTNIIQQYIDPLLYNGRKFDIRIWAVWTGRKLWWYRQGYLRTSSKQFTLKSLNKFIHLTNDAIQSQSQDFGKHEPANKLSFNQFQKYLQSQHNYHGFYTQMLKQMKNIAIKAFRMGNIVFDNQNRKYNFQLFGLDFLIDKNYKPWLIQCNTNPCLQINCSLLARLVPNMLQNVMNLTVDTYFPPPTKRKQRQSVSWNHQTFKFQLLYDGINDLEMKEKLLIKNIQILYNTQYEEELIQSQ